MKLLPAALLAAMVAGAFAAPVKDYKFHVEKIPTSDGEWALAFPAKPSRNAEIEAAAPADGCQRTYYEYKATAFLVNVLIKDCPAIKLTAARREYWFAQMREELDRLTKSPDAPTTTHKVRWRGIEGREMRRLAKGLEIRTRTYAGQHSVVWMTAFWNPASPSATQSALRFLDPL